MSETEALGITFEIDHFHPIAEGGAAADYSNLNYSCDVCNGTKGKIWPSENLVSQGYWLLSPDRDDLFEHYDLRGYELHHLTNAGQYTIEVIRLNRRWVKELREKREVIWGLGQQILGGLRAIASSHIDRLDPIVRARVRAAAEVVKRYVESMDLSEEVRLINASAMLDVDKDSNKQRREFLRGLNALVAPSK